MRFPALLAAVLLATAPLLSSCDAVGPDSSAPLAEASSPSTATAQAAMHCAYLNGPSQLDSGQSASYTAGINSWCGSDSGSVTWSIQGDGTIDSLPWDESKSASSASSVQVSAANISYGSFILTASFNGPSYSGSISKTVTVGTPPPPPPASLGLSVQNQFNGVLVTWNSSVIPANASRCELYIRHYNRGSGTIDERTVLVGGGSYLDQMHQYTGGSSIEMLYYSLKVFDAAGQQIAYTNSTAGGAGTDRNQIEA